MSLVEVYRLLRQQVRDDSGATGDPAEIERKLDAVYARIVSAPVSNIAVALEKLWFAHLCLTDEFDFKEAANLIDQVCRAFDALPQSAAEDAGGWPLAFCCRAAQSEA